MFALDRRAGSLGEQLAVALRESIADGRLAAGTRLPASRDLAGELGVSRGVVVGAYEQLLAEGRLTARHGSGTFVGSGSGSGSGSAVPPEAPGPVRPAPVVALRPGIPDLARFPRQAWRRAYEAALRTAADSDLDYGDPAGAPRLRAELAGYLRRVRAARVEAEGLLVTSGAAQALALLAAVLRARGADRIGVEDPGSPAIREHLIAAGLRPVPVPVDADGLDVAALSRGRLPAVLVTPAHQFPTGVVLSPARRTALIAWAVRTGGLIVEDDYDAEFRYDRDPVGCLQGMAPQAVALVGSVSKALAPALRLGWLAGPAGLMAELAVAKSAADNGGPVLEQLALAQLLASGGYDRHLRTVRRLYRGRRDVAVAAVAEHLPAATVTGVAAGMHLLVTLPPGVDDVALAGRAGARGIGALALSTTRVGAAGPPGLVIGYGAMPPDRLRAAVAAIGRLLR
ncbi:PLP-dependent aminotransferase family protein [Rugosimonospora acidiphila]|uniref:PLP-dependent aminotransferase family protein n=1 Tax=Rugosimonospora acidiphila TaxID=556531 RepID=A0ABP9RJD1_9ACTN